MNLSIVNQNIHSFSNHSLIISILLKKLNQSFRIQMRNLAGDRLLPTIVHSQEGIHLIVKEKQ
jgi:hypothetical protein